MQFVIMVSQIYDSYSFTKTEIKRKPTAPGGFATPLMKAPAIPPKKAPKSDPPPSSPPPYKIVFKVLF